MRKSEEHIVDSRGEPAAGRTLGTVAFVCGRLDMDYVALRSRLAFVQERGAAMEVRWRIRPSHAEMDAFRAAWEWHGQDGESVVHLADPDVALRWDYESGTYVDMG